MMKQKCIAAYSALIVTAMFVCMPARTQLSSTVTTITHDSTFARGRDFWFAMQSNNWGVNLGSKYMRIYVTADENCTAYVGSNSTNVIPFPVTAYKLSSYLIPESWEMESSGIAENKAIHVWSNTADLTVYDLSYNEYSSDGSYIIPTIGWGTDYVVAAYGSIDDSQGSFGTDLPSTMVIVADQDNTSVDITPSCNCRKDSTGNVNGDDNSMAVAFPAGQTFTILLNRGQSMQLIPIFLEGPPFLDLTGTIVHSNKPVGVMAGSQETNIPSVFPYAEHVEDMMPPVRSWGETYYANNTVQPPGMPKHDVAQYLFISSVPNQMIFSQQCNTYAATECVIAKQYGIFWDEIKGAQKFFSAQPFLVVEYSNSNTYPDDSTGSGAPAEAILTPREQYTKSVTFETPISVGNIVPYTDYANITVHVNDEKKTLFNGKSITRFSKQCLDSNWDIFFVDAVVDVDSVTGDDSGVGVWVYGNGFYDAYAWAGPAQCKTFQSPDSVPPVATITESCLSGHVDVQDTGTLASTLDMIRLDTVYNMNYLLDTAWIDGSMRDSTFYNFEVVDPAQPAYLRVSAFDYAGNRTTITSIYRINFDSLKPFYQNLGVSVISGTVPNIAYDTLFNVGEDTTYLSELHLQNDSLGFSLHDSIGGPLNLSSLAPKHRAMIQIQFKALKTIPVVDSIVASDVCESLTATVVGSGATSDFVVSSQTWLNEPLTGLQTCYPEPVVIWNYLNTPIIIDSAGWADTIHFKAVTPFPITVPAHANVQFTIDYCPDSGSQIASNRTQGSWFSSEVLDSDGKTQIPIFDSLIGSAHATPANVGKANNSASQATIIPSNDGHSLEIILPADINGPVSFTLVNVLGQSVLRSTFGAGTQNVDASSLPRGVYFYRLNAGQMTQSGKVILGE